jgi:hypothetical protein
VKELRLVTDADGVATTSLFPGAYALEVRDGSLLRKPSVVVPLERAPRVTIVVPAEPVRLEGRVFDRDTKEPIAGKAVYALTTSEDAELLGSAETDADGRFAIEGLSAGTVRIEAALSSPYSYAMREVEIALGARASVEIAVPRLRGPGAVPRTVPLDVVLRDATSGAPIADASVGVLCLWDGTWVYDADAVKTDAGGRASILVPAAAGWRLRVHRWSAKPPRYAAKDFPLTPVGGRLQAEVRLTPDPTNLR